LWQLKLRQELTKLGFKPLIANYYIYRHPDSELIVLTYVDDFLLVGLKGKELDNLKSALQSVFKIKDLGPCQYFVGIRIVRNRKERTISIV
jgi:ribosomal protein S3